MGCGCIEEAENKQTIVSENQPKKIINEGEKKSEKENKKSKGKEKEKEKEKKKEKEKEKEKHKQKSKRKAEKDQDILDINKRKINDKIIISQVADDNKDALSNVATEGVTTTDGQILATRKQQCNGVTILQGIEECFSEDLDEDDILQIVGDALADHIIEGCDEQIPGTVTFDQVRVIAKILYKKISKKNDDEDEKDGEINMKNYPELKGLNIRIGVSQLTKDVIKKMMFSGQKVDDCQIDLTYANLIKDNSNMKALSIEILP
jgi:hypothetical protein